MFNSDQEANLAQPPVTADPVAPAIFINDEKDNVAALSKPESSVDSAEKLDATHSISNDLSSRNDECKA